MNRTDSYVQVVKAKPNGIEPAGLRRQAIAADAASTMEVNLTLLWRELVNGLCSVVDDFFTDDRCYVVLRPTFDGGTERLAGRRLQILQAVLAGQGQKNIAIDLGLAPSTVALNARLALESLGLRCKASRVHPLLMLAAQAEAKQGSRQTATLSFVSSEHEQLRIVSIPRPDRRLSNVLPPAELAVIRYLVEGLPYGTIAHLRGTSTRTIANQITAVFRRMRTSGRSELLIRLFFADGLDHAALPLTPRETLVPNAGIVAVDRRSA